MQQFTLPQFIERETHVFGPVTIRQFVLVVVAGLFIVLGYKVIGSPLYWILFSLAVVGFFGVIAFKPVNGRPFHFFILNVFESYSRPRILVWNKSLAIHSLALEQIKTKKSDVKTKEEAVLVAKRLPNASQLSRLSLTVDTGGAYREDDF